MITVLVHYKELKKAHHPMLDDIWNKRSKVVEVEKLTDLNDMFKHIRKIDILYEVIYSEEECMHPWADVMGDGNMKPAKCLKCGKVLSE